MKIKRHKFKCSVPGCKNTDSIVMGKGTYFDVGCLHLCRDCAMVYANAWKDALTAEGTAGEKATGEEIGEKRANTEKNAENSGKTSAKRVNKAKNVENSEKTAKNSPKNSTENKAAVTA